MCSPGTLRRLCRPVQTSCCFSQVRLEKRMPQTWHLVACGTKRAVSPDLWPHGLGFVEVPRERGDQRASVLACVPETACRAQVLSLGAFCVETTDMKTSY